MIRKHDSTKHIWQSLTTLEELVIFTISTPARPAVPPFSVWPDDDGSLCNNHGDASGKQGFFMPRTDVKELRYFSDKAYKANFMNQTPNSSPFLGLL